MLLLLVATLILALGLVNTIPNATWSHNSTAMFHRLLEKGSVPRTLLGLIENEISVARQVKGLPSAPLPIATTTRPCVPCAPRKSRVVFPLHSDGGPLLRGSPDLKSMRAHGAESAPSP